MQNVPFILLRNCQKLSISVPSIAHTEENKTSRSYAKNERLCRHDDECNQKNYIVKFLNTNFISALLYFSRQIEIECKGGQ